MNLSIKYSNRILFIQNDINISNSRANNSEILVVKSINKEINQQHTINKESSQVCEMREYIFKIIKDYADEGGLNVTLNKHKQIMNIESNLEKYKIKN